MKKSVRPISDLFVRRWLPENSGRLRSSALVEKVWRQWPALATTSAWGVSIFLAAWIVSGWFWDRIAPAPAFLPMVTETDPVAAASSVAMKHLMGVPKSQPASSDAPRRSSFRLLGLMTASSRWPGFAILSQNDREPLVVVEGEEIVPGVSLLQIMSDQVVIGRDGNKESLGLNLP